MPKSRKSNSKSTLLSTAVFLLVLFWVQNAFKTKSVVNKYLDLKLLMKVCFVSAITNLALTVYQSANDSRRDPERVLQLQDCHINIFFY